MNGGSVTAASAERTAISVPSEAANCGSEATATSSVTPLLCAFLAWILFELIGGPEACNCVLGMG